VQVVPVSSKIQRLYPSEAYITIKNESCKAMADQVTTAPKSRLKNKIDVLSAADMHEIERVLKIQLGLK
jgi:mRNA interferase MazF